MRMDGAGLITASWLRSIAATLIMVLVAVGHFKTPSPPGRRDRDAGLETILGLLVSAVSLARFVAPLIVRVEAEAMENAHDLPGG